MGVVVHLNNYNYSGKITKSEIKKYICNNKKEAMESFGLTETDIKNIDADKVGIVLEDEILIIDRPCAVMDRGIGRLLRCGTYKEMSDYYEEIYTAYDNLANGSNSKILRAMKQDLFLVELPRNSSIVQKVWGSQYYINKIVTKILDNRK